MVLVEEERKKHEDIDQDDELEDDNNENVRSEGGDDVDIDVAKLTDLDQTDMNKFQHTPAPKGKMIQCTITRDKSTVGKKFLPVYHVTNIITLTCRIKVLYLALFLI